MTSEIKTRTKISENTLQKAEADPNVKVVITEGEGDKAFCAGGDIRGVVPSIENLWGTIQDIRY